MSTTQTRRNALRLFAGPPVLAILPMMMAPSDAHLLAMEAEIMLLRGQARAIYAEKVDPFEDEFHALMRVGDEAPHGHSPVPMGAMRRSRRRSHSIFPPIASANG
jgi:hypothetical protein